MTFIVIVTKTKDHLYKINKMLKELCHVDYCSGNLFGSKIDDVNYMLLSLDSNHAEVLKGRTVDKIYFIMDKDDIPVDYLKILYPMMCSYKGKLLFSDKFNLNLLVS